jgi:hypothetical protein
MSIITDPISISREITEIIYNLPIQEVVLVCDMSHSFVYMSISL